MPGPAAAPLSEDELCPVCGHPADEHDGKHGCRAADCLCWDGPGAVRAMLEAEREARERLAQRMATLGPKCQACKGPRDEHTIGQGVGYDDVRRTLCSKCAWPEVNRRIDEHARSTPRQRKAKAAPPVEAPAPASPDEPCECGHPAGGHDAQGCAGWVLPVPDGGLLVVATRANVRDMAHQVGPCPCKAFRAPAVAQTSLFSAAG